MDVSTGTCATSEGAVTRRSCLAPCEKAWDRVKEAGYETSLVYGCMSLSLPLSLSLTDSLSLSLSLLSPTVTRAVHVHASFPTMHSSKPVSFSSAATTHSVQARRTFGETEQPEWHLLSCLVML